MYEKVEFQVKGTSPLVFHNGQLANPLNPLVKEIKVYTSKRTKTDADQLEIARLEFAGSLYLNDKGRVILPAEGVESFIRDAGKTRKLGKKMQAGVVVFDDPILEYDGPKTVEGLWEDERFRMMKLHKVSQSRVLRCHPIFRDWSCTFTVSYLPELIQVKELIDVVTNHGRLGGWFELRPRYGRFEVTKSTKIAA